MVTILRHLRRLSQLLQITRFNRAAHVVNLVARIINVVFTSYFVSGKIKHVAKSIPYGCTTCMT
ncbi:hypothetical protein D3C77_716690 [compost metagenome]